MDWIELPPARSWSASRRQAFAKVAGQIARSRAERDLPVLRQGPLVSDPSLRAALLLLADLRAQGWKVTVRSGVVKVAAPEENTTTSAEKERVRRQELLKRDEQLRKPSVRRFIADMEKPRDFGGAFVSVYSLMRDGRHLATALQALSPEGATHPTELRAIIDPYVQIIHPGERCNQTGLRLTDIWRYFRHTWSNQYTSTPGRSMQVLVRDRAAKYHPVIGIAALTSAVVQIRERDEWIGWQPAGVVEALAEKPTIAAARWIVDRLEASLDEIHVDDLLADGLYWPSLWTSPDVDAAARLDKEAETRRRDHHRFVHRSELKAKVPADSNGWVDRAETDLYRSKRCLALAELLRAKAALLPHLYPTPTRDGLRRALADPAARRALAGIVRRAKAETVGTEIADLSVCGAIAPYNKLLGGKLVSMLAVSPSVVRAYRERYACHVSEIASGMAGRPITRRANLVYIGTTSLYGAGSSQYNRLRLPSDVLGSTKPMEFQRIGMSQSFGTSHLSAKTVAALVALSEQSRYGVRVNSIFGEGVNPKMRKVRDGLDRLGWPSEALLQHGRQRIVYAVALAANLRAYLLGMEDKPRYIFPAGVVGDTDKITAWWWQRWLSGRIRSGEVMARLGEDSTDRPVSHGARVVLPAVGEEDDGVPRCR